MAGFVKITPAEDGIRSLRRRRDAFALPVTNKRCAAFLIFRAGAANTVASTSRVRIDAITTILARLVAALASGNLENPFVIMHPDLARGIDLPGAPLLAFVFAVGNS